MLEISASRAEAEAHLYSYAQYTLLPRLSRLEQLLTEQLASRYDDRLFLRFADPRPENKELRLQEMEARIRSGYSSINEERAIDGREPVPWGDVPILPMTMGPIGSAPPAAGSPKMKGLVKPLDAEERRLARLLHETWDKQLDEVQAKLHGR